ncbi:MAG: hypothetical protein B7X04_00050 [Parcubacteria group bacterium 21-54-25]|nr:MAG: hypothetical protein B7W98_00030 [Parcubacteria group bacterium 20-58-5]OYV84230.1 MAG: hypothetical protein B7X04_00050 [Parcubacteria group bacterium 21-54-25]HQU08163.1 DUF302 domain-containing protein [Candidatus Paceibacterota bacterium]
MNYSIQKRIAGTFAEAVEKTKAALATEGFGVLTEIDVAATMKKKLDVEFDNYLILGACNPTLAHQALQAEKEIGLFLPCNVIVYENEGGVVVSAIRPTAAMSMVHNERLGGIAREAEKRLRAAVDSI